MKKKIVLLISLLVVSNYICGQLRHIEIPGAEEHIIGINITDQNTFIGSGKWSNKIYKTTDGGDTWTFKEVNTNYPGRNEAISFINENIGYVLTNESVNGGVFAGGTEVLNLYKTTDGGDSWELITPGGLDPETTSYNAGNMLFFNEYTGIMNVAGVLWRTTNAGDSWDAIGEYPHLTRYDYNDSGVAYFTKKYQNTVTVYYSNDYGATWEEIEIPEIQKGYVASKVHLIDNIAYIHFQDELAILEDGEVKNVYELPVVPFVYIGGDNQQYIIKVSFILENNDPVENTVELWSSSDNGINLNLIDTLDEDTDFAKADFAFNKAVLAGTHGDIIIFENPDTNTNTLEPNHSIDINLYPNPVLKGQNINIIGQLPIGKIWKIFNTKGQVIQTGIITDTQINISNINEIGVYFFELYSGKRIIYSKKFMIR